MLSSSCNSKLAALAVAALLAATLAGCSSGQGGADVMAKVNGHKIMRSEVDKYYDNQTAGSPQQPTDEQATTLKLNILKELIDNEILMQRAEKLGLLATNEEVDQKLNEIRGPYTQDQFNDRLKERKMSLDDLKRELRRNITVDKVLNKEINSKINVTDVEIAAYYNAHKPEFNLIEPQYHLAHIFVSVQPNPAIKTDKAQNPDEAKKKIEMIANRLDSGEDFATVAQRYSEDPDSAGNGGDLGFTPQSALAQTDPATRDAISKLKPGQYSAVLTVTNPQTRQLFGYRIVKLVGKEPAGQRELNDPRVQTSIHDQLVDRREQLLKAAYYDVVRDQAKIENYFAEQILKTAQK